jgi:hypothetical protein
MLGKIKCPDCGISVPDVPEDAAYDEMLCNACASRHDKIVFLDASIIDTSVIDPKNLLDPQCTMQEVTENKNGEKK